MFHQIIVIADTGGTRKRVKGLATQQSMPWNVQMLGKGKKIVGDLKFAF